jgi:hypothetical protein
MTVAGSRSAWAQGGATALAAALGEELGPELERCAGGKEPGRGAGEDLVSHWEHWDRHWDSTRSQRYYSRPAERLHILTVATVWSIGAYTELLL